MDYQIETELHADGARIYYDIYASVHDKAGVLSPPHIHSYYEIITCQGGDMQFRFDQSETCTLHEQDIIIIFPNTVHETFIREQNKKGFITQRVIKFSPFFLYPMNSVSSDIQYLLLPLKYKKNYMVIPKGTEDHGYLFDLLAKSCEEWKKKKPGFEISIRANCSLIYTYLLRHAAIIEIPDPIPSESDIDHIDVIYKAVSYVEKHYQHPISMRQVAEECNVNYYHFSRLFQQCTNQKFSDYVLSFRIGKARKMLLQTNTSITNISIDCGFETISYFIKKFQSVTGLTPKKFRAKYLGTDPESIQSFSEEPDELLLLEKSENN